MADCEQVRGRHFIITGSAGGLGRAFAEELLQAGALVCLSDVNQQVGQNAELELGSAFGQDRVKFVPCDVTRESSVEELWSKAESLLGPVHCLVNNAGVMGEREGWKLTLDINLKGVIHGTNIAMSKLSKAEGGSGGLIVNIASILGLFSSNQPGGFPYNCTKTAVVTLSRCLGNSFSSTGVRVVCLCPSVAQTPILDACSQEEIDRMSKEVGGLMAPSWVASAFLRLVRSGPPGSVMAVWNKVPPYYIPDTGMPLFIFYTTCAMMMRWVPGVKEVRSWMLPFCLLAIFASWWLAAIISSSIWAALT